MDRLKKGHLSRGGLFAFVLRGKVRFRYYRANLGFAGAFGKGVLIEGPAC